ncbi:MAG TPA: hypothetical protein VMF88_05490 [Bacteroidota bacterium]|nr:hypothetical protein [Bacteroidota bacterium]
MAKQSKGGVTTRKPVFEEDENVRNATKNIMNQVRTSRLLEDNYSDYLEKVLSYWVTEYYSIIFPLISYGTLKFVYKDGKSMIEFTEKEIVRIAKQKYTKKHFQEVDRLIKKGYKTEKAYQEVADKYTFSSWEGFGKQYQKRYLDKKITPKKK